MTKSSQKINILNFDEMLTPQVITFVYWLGLAAIILGGIGSIAAGHIIPGLVTLIVGFIGWRIWCELLIVLFKINENVQKIADRGINV